MEDYKSILRRLLDDRCISQKVLADSIGTTEATISRCLSGVNVPSVNIMLAISVYLNVSLDFLMGRTPIPDMKTRRDGQTFIIGNAFSRCTERDKGIIMAILSDYLTEEEASYLLENQNAGGV